MVYCPRCGKPVDEADLFCRNCGARVPRGPARVKPAEGRVDRKKGLLEGRARNVEGADEIVQGRFQSVFDPDRIIRFRAELTDSQGNAEYIPVEVACRARKWVGMISEGDKFSAEGKFEKDGILHVKRLYNQTTNSVVGEK